MDTGLYLVIRTFTNDKNDEYVIEPFLVSIPQMIEDKVVFNVVVRPKYSIISDNESSKEEESSIPESSEPSRDISENSETFLTGDNTKEFGLLYMGTAFGSVITVIFILEKKNKV